MIRLSAALAAVVLLLSGCFGVPSIPPTGGSEGGGTSGQTDDSTSGDEMFQGLPATFPTDVPLLPGEVAMGIDVGTGWAVIVLVDDLQTDFEAASALLKGAGFEALTESSSDDGSFGVFENAKYQVQVTASDAEDYGLNLNYLVVKKD